MKTNAKYDDENLIELFLDKVITEKNLSISTVNSYNSDLKTFSKFLRKHKFNLLNCSKKALDFWITHLVSQGVKVSSRLRKISVAKQFFNFIHREKFRDNNPTLNIILPKKVKSIPRFLNESDVEKLLYWLRENSKTFKDLQILVLTEVLYATGLRVSELVGLKLSSISDDFKNLYITGKGNKDRVLPLGEYAQKLLKDYISDKKFIRVKEKKRIFKNWLFPYSKKHITRQTYYNKLKRAAIKATIESKGISPHLLRHAFASHMLKNGADLKVIQHLLGHEDISTVEIYTHINIDDTVKALKKHPLNKQNT